MQVLSYVSDDFKTWRYLGEQWKAENGSMAGASAPASTPDLCLRSALTGGHLQWFVSLHVTI